MKLLINYILLNQVNIRDLKQQNKEFIIWIHSMLISDVHFLHAKCHVQILKMHSSEFILSVIFSRSNCLLN